MRGSGTFLLPATPFTTSHEVPKHNLKLTYLKMFCINPILIGRVTQFIDSKKNVMNWKIFTKKYDAYEKCVELHIWFLKAFFSTFPNEMLYSYLQLNSTSLAEAEIIHFQFWIFKYNCIRVYLYKTENANTSSTHYDCTWLDFNITHQ